MVKIPNRPEANQLTIYKRGLEVALWTTENKFSQRLERGLNSEPLDCNSSDLTVRPRYLHWFIAINMTYILML